MLLNCLNNSNEDWSYTSGRQRRATEDNSVRGEESQMTWADLPGISIRYELSGQGPNSLILLHELGGSLESFDVCIDGLEDGNRILRYDQRGAGFSEKPRASFTLADHVADLLALTEHVGLKPPCRLLGVAAGAAIAVALAIENPDLVEALVLCSPALGTVPERQVYLMQRSAMAEEKGMRAIADATLERSYPQSFREDEKAYQTYLARFLANDPVAYGHANRALTEAKLIDQLDRITAPCLVLAGAHDVLRPKSEMLDICGRLPRGEFAEVSSGHLMPVQAPGELVAETRRFLTSLGESPAGGLQHSPTGGNPE
jgi:3-oxoadipate enol-lactonase